MRILFATKLIEDRNFQPPGIYSISAVLKKAGYETFIVDATSVKAVSEAVRKLNPHVLAISMPTGRYRFFQRLAAQLKTEFPDLFVVAGGIHVTLVPESIEDEGIDAVCRGEGDFVLSELVGKLENGDNYLETRGFWFKKGEEIVKNPVASLITDLDSLPFGDREITDIYPYCRKMPVGAFITSRGCPFSCTYCDNDSVRNLYENAPEFYREYSPLRAIEEIRWFVSKYNYKRLAFMSEIFGMRKDWLAEFSELYKRDVAIPFWCMLHPSLVTTERAEMLAHAGCVAVELGIESGSWDVRRNILKRYVTNEQILSSIQILHKYKIRVQATNILGLPGSDLEKEFETVDLNAKAKVDFPDVCIFQPFPKTPLTEMAIKMGIFDGDFDKLPPTVNPSNKRFVIVDVPYKKILENLGFLFPIAAKSRIVRRILPFMIKLPLRLLYLSIHKIAITYFKIRHLVGSFDVFSFQFAKIFWNYIKY